MDPPSESCCEYGAMYAPLKKVFGDKCLLCSWVFKWFKRLKEGRKNVSDDVHCGHPRHPATLKTGTNIEKISEIV